MKTLLAHIPDKVISEMKFLADAIFMLTLYIGGALTLDLELRSVIVIVLASLSGAVVLSYFRRDRDYREIFYKSACAAICGLVCGAAIARYFQIEHVEYIIINYFLSALLSLFFIRGLLYVTEQNATNVLLVFLQRVLNTQTKTETKLTVTPETETTAREVKLEITEDIKE